MKIFQVIRRNFALAGISPTLVFQAYPFNQKILMGCLILSLGLISMFMYVFNDAQTLAEYTQSVYVFAIGIFISAVLIIVLLNIELIFNLIDRCEGLANTTSKYFATSTIFAETNELVEKLSEIIFFVTVIMTPVFAILLWPIYVYIIYFSTDAGNETFELIFVMWFPFDWRNPFGFFMAVTMQYILASYVLIIGVCVLALAIGTCLNVVATTKCMKGCLFAIGYHANGKINRSVLLEQVHEFIQFHSTIKQFISGWLVLCKQFITVVFIWSLITICGSLLLIQHQMSNHEDNLVVLLTTLFEVIYAYGILLLVCELGQRVNFAFDECSEMIEQLEWYLFPMEIQRLLPSILQFTQQPIEIKCFGSAACDRETFKSIIKTAFSYFTVIRQFM